MAQKTAPANGVIRHESGSARRISAGAVIPDGWSFEDGKAEAKATATKKPKETTQAKGPSETAEATKP